MIINQIKTNLVSKLKKLGFSNILSLIKFLITFLYLVKYLTLAKLLIILIWVKF